MNMHKEGLHDGIKKAKAKATPLRVVNDQLREHAFQIR